MKDVKLKAGLVSAATGSYIFKNRYLAAAGYAVGGFNFVGGIMKLAQILKIINKLYFININYGKRLDAFLKTISHGSRYDSINDADKLVLHERNSRGKLSSSKYILDGIQNMTFEYVIYLACWITLTISWIVQQFKIQISRYVF